jgi:hypothetical protein
MNYEDLEPDEYYERELQEQIEIVEAVWKLIEWLFVLGLLYGMARLIN